VSHYQERKEKDCLNCGTEVAGRYCQKCGQENIIARESFWSLVTHFVYDITHFDNKFFGTIGKMLTKPGQVSLEYTQGKRNSQLNPIRMYVFTSAFFFIIFFSTFSLDNIGRGDTEIRKERLANLQRARQVLEEQSLQSSDSIERATARKVYSDLQAEIAVVQQQLEAARKKDSSNIEQTQDLLDSLQQKGVPIKPTRKKKNDLNFDWSVDSTEKPYSFMGYYSQEAYQRMQQALPNDKRDGWVRRAFTTKIIAATEAGQTQGEKAMIRAFSNNLVHNFPKMLFVSLPFFAWFLSILYARKKRWFYSDHAIFTIHTYCATFIFLLGLIALGALKDATGWGIIGWLRVIGAFAVWLYLYKAMRKYYGEGRSKTILKFTLLNILSFIMMLFLLVIFTAISAMQIANATH
jgi:hypothetical protein